MKKILFVMIALLALCSCGGDKYIAHITDLRLVSVNPQNGYPGDLVTIFGRNFSPEQSENEVFVGGEPARVVEAAEGRLQIVLPPLEPGSYPVRVIAPSGEQEGLTINYLKVPDHIYMVTTIVGQQGQRGGKTGEMPQMNRQDQNSEQPADQPHANGQAASGDHSANQPQANGRGQRGGKLGGRGQMNGQEQRGGRRGEMPRMNGQTQNGQQPATPPQTNSQAQNGEQPADLSQTNNQTQNSEQPATPPQANGQPQNGANPPAPPQANGQAPVMIDFDAMVTKNVISQETCDKIKAYMESHKPAALPDTNGQAPTGEQPATPPEASGEQPAEGTAPAQGGLLADLLKDGIITQAEYDALTAAQ